MSIELILSNLLNAPVLFFFLGVLAILVKSDLDFPAPLPKLFSLYLLLSIGFKGGVELAHSGLSVQIFKTLVAAMAVSAIIPIYSFFILRQKMDVPNAAGIAAAYGSVSAVTYIAATSFLARLDVPFNGHMVAAMALMESPAILAGVFLYRKFRSKTQQTHEESVTELVREAFFNGSVFLLIGSFLIGFITGAEGEAALKPFTNDLFKGVLCLFLLDMGLVSARRFAQLKKLGRVPILFALLMPLPNAILGIMVAWFSGMNVGDALLFATLCASASYIAVPAALRLSVPEANPGVYVTMALAVTFPFNILVGLPIYLGLIRLLWP
ncbi:MAG: sodium-dependent bicarbonate transport family permease [Bacteroidetes Order II. Incertae sedis bacterium]|nr:sodium-dependent bicarbonate transport family permease [Bacteroidetes Order II. bacterium]